MEYYRRPIFSGLEKISERGEPLVDYEVLELIATMAKKLKQKTLLGEECDLKDGRKKWMVRYSKFAKLRRNYSELKIENRKLKEAILKLSS
jgi:hypothetical protein